MAEQVTSLKPPPYDVNAVGGTPAWVNVGAIVRNQAPDGLGTPRQDAGSPSATGRARASNCLSRGQSQFTRS